MATVELEKMYLVKDKQIAGAQNILNIYTVQRSDPTARALSIGQAFEDDVLPKLLVRQATNLSHSVIEIENFVDPSDFATVVPTLATGTRVGEALSTFSSFTIQFNRLRTDMKNGQKRYYVGVETDIVTNFWTSGFITEMEIVRDAVLSPWVRDATPGIIECNMVVIKRICVGSPPPVPCVSYRFPVDDAELVFYNPTTGIARVTMRSQVSRKRLV